MTQPPTGRPPRGPHPPRGQRGPAPARSGRRRVAAVTVLPKVASAHRRAHPPTGRSPQGARQGPPQGARQGALQGPPPPLPQGGHQQPKKGPGKVIAIVVAVLVVLGLGRIRGVEARRPGRERCRRDGSGRCGRRERRCRNRRRPGVVLPGVRRRHRRRARERGLDRPRHRRRRRAGVRLTFARGRPEVLLGDRLPQREALTGRPLRRRGRGRALRRGEAEGPERRVPRQGRVRRATRRSAPLPTRARPRRGRWCAAAAR